jgi:hypothetical protein
LITETVDMWILRLNKMTERAETFQTVACGDTKESLIDLLKNETVPFYKDEQWNKNYKKGGPLEWYNLPHPDLSVGGGHAAIVDVGTREDWMRKAGEDFDNLSVILYRA